MTLALFDGTLSGTSAVLLILAMTIALGFECVNGFHDTANAVATVIYTRSLEPGKAVVWSGICNFLGVYLGGTAVAFSILNLLPVDLLVSSDAGSGLAMVLALLLAATTWNLGTWYVGIPASSSHTLVGSILGVGLVNSTLRGRPISSGVNWAKAGEVGLSLLISPVIGFVLAALLLVLMRRLIPRPELFAPPPDSSPPPFWIRSTLIATCTGVSFAHGSNDGQKGIGLVMLILIGLVPSHFALNPTHAAGEVAKVIGADEVLQTLVERHASTEEQSELRRELAQVHRILEGRSKLSEVAGDQRWVLRTRLILIDRALDRLEKNRSVKRSSDRARIKKARASLASAINYAPTWVLVSVAGALGLGTMVGWRRIVITVGEKIGKTHMTYAQGAAAEIVAMSTIALADFGGMPVSTTHVLSSGVAGTMAASRAGLQFKTVRNIAIAWVLTLPVSMALSAALFTALRPLLATLR
ncbi:MAG: inorganic phosphate transporter [Isosphaeraceae bacterium]